MDVELTDLQCKILLHLRPDEPLTAREVAVNIKANESVVFQYLKTLHKNGYVGRSDVFSAKTGHIRAMWTKEARP